MPVSVMPIATSNPQRKWSVASPPSQMRSPPPPRSRALHLRPRRTQLPVSAGAVVEGLTAQGALEQLTETAAARMFPEGLPQAYRDQIAHELG